jgi:flagellar biosynthetic protein FliQ
VSAEFVIGLGQDALLTVLLVSAPILGLGLLVGLAVSIFQATTQINEQTLTFVPKIIVILTAIVLFGPWMINILLEFTAGVFGQLHTLAR